jgi:hypothetical protein
MLFVVTVLLHVNAYRGTCSPTLIKVISGRPVILTSDCQTLGEREITSLRFDTAGVYLNIKKMYDIGGFFFRWVGVCLFLFKKMCKSCRINKDEKASCFKYLLA